MKLSNVSRSVWLITYVSEKFGKVSRFRKMRHTLLIIGKDYEHNATNALVNWQEGVGEGCIALAIENIKMPAAKVGSITDLASAKAAIKAVGGTYYCDKRGPNSWSLKPDARGMRVAKALEAAADKVTFTPYPPQLLGTPLQRSVNYKNGNKRFHFSK